MTSTSRLRCSELLKRFTIINCPFSLTNGQAASFVEFAIENKIEISSGYRNCTKHHAVDNGRPEENLPAQLGQS